MQWFSISVFETDDIGSNPILVAYVVFSLTGKVPPCDGVEQGSSPGDNRREKLKYWLVAQWKTHRTFNPGVLGSSPSGPTKDE